MHALAVPAEVADVFREFRTCELSTLARDGTPVTWPTAPLWQPERGSFVVTTSIGLPQKAYNIRRDPRVALLFSDPTGSGLPDPPAVLVQGEAVCPDEIVTRSDELDALARLVYARQPASARYARNALARRLSDWYCMRLVIRVTPLRIRWWPGGDFSTEASELEAGHVG